MSNLQRRFAAEDEGFDNYSQIHNGAYYYLDLTAKGRDEDWSQEFASSWVRHHDRYGKS